MLGADPAGAATTVGMTPAAAAGEGTSTSKAVESAPLGDATASAAGAARSKIASFFLLPSSLT